MADRVRVGQRKETLMAFASIALLVVTMLVNLTHSPLWGDEWEEMSISQMSLFTGEMYHAIIGTFQPPLYNLLLHVWLLPSQSMWWFRLLNVLLGIACGVLLWRTVKRLVGPWPATVGVVCLACCYQWVYCIQECSEYTLMLTFLFAAIYNMVRLCEAYSLRRLVLLVLSCTGAMYSQYGAAFVVVPLLLMVFGEARSQRGKEGMVEVGKAYAVCALLLALPLYVFFLRNQLSSVGGSSVGAELTFWMIPQAFTTLGNILGYFFHAQTLGLAGILWAVVGVALLAWMVWLAMRGGLVGARRVVLLALLVAYALHYPLVQLHLYAMVHPGQSYGFFCRYSYFYLPLFSVGLPVLADEAVARTRDRIPKAVWSVAAGLGVVCCAFSLVALLQNWHKSFDDEFARTYVEEGGAGERTYLLGAHADDGFNQYVVPQSPVPAQALLEACRTEVDLNDLPSVFWVWHDNWDWGSEGYQELIEGAEERGYEATVFFDYRDPVDENNYYVLARYQKPAA